MRQKCPNCDGQRFVENSAGMLVPCPHCDGTGADPGIETFRVYVYDVALNAGQRLENQRVVIDGGASFRLKALAGTQTGDYRVRFRHSSGEYMSTGGVDGSNDLVNNANIIGTAQFPFPVVPSSLYPPSGHVLIDIEDLTGSPNTVQIALIGANVYPTPAA